MLQALFFSSLLPVEAMTLDTFFSDSLRGIYVSTITGYPVKTLVFESNYNLKKMGEVIAKICSHLQEKCILYNLLIRDCGKKIFLFLQVKYFLIFLMNSIKLLYCTRNFLLQGYMAKTIVLGIYIASNLGPWMRMDTRIGSYSWRRLWSVISTITSNANIESNLLVITFYPWEFGKLHTSWRTFN